MFESLQILHMYNYAKPKGEQCLVKQFRQSANPLALSTCMRHIYIFSAAQFQTDPSSFHALLEHLENPGKYQARCQYDYLQGEQAYVFLLMWSIGAFNPKNPFDDSRILGELRATLHQYEHSQNKKLSAAWQANKDIAIMLRLDGKRLHEWVKSLPSSLSYDDKLLLAKKACQNCVWLRSKGILPFITQLDYSMLTDTPAMMAHLKDKLAIMELKCYEALEKREKICGSEIGFFYDSAKTHLDDKLLEIRKFRRALFSQEHLITPPTL